jgi:hypothetical protein
MPVQPLSRDEIREGVKRLKELKIVREDLSQREKYIAELGEITRQRAELMVVMQRANDDRVKAVEAQRDFEKEKAAHTQMLLDEITKKRKGGMGCTMRAIFSLGISRCG